MKFCLKPVDGRKSFGGKCHVEVVGNVSFLYSYDTLVSEYHHLSNTMLVHGWYSATTARHINSFLAYYGFDTCTKKEMENYNA